MAANIGNASCYCQEVTPWTPDLSDGVSVSMWTYLVSGSIAIGSVNIRPSPGGSSETLSANYMNTNLRIQALMNWDPYIFCVSSNNAIISGTMMHMVTTYDNTALKCYINGVEKASITSSVGVTDLPHHLDYMFYNDLFRFWPGTAEETRIYDRGLLPSEVIAIHKARGKDNIYNGLLNRWSFCEGAPGVTVTTNIGFIKDDGPRGDNMTYRNINGSYAESHSIGPGLKRRYR